MKIERKDFDKLNATLHLVVEPADYEENVKKQLKDIRRKANIPGFRPGMVPQGLIQKMYGKAVLGDEVNKAINKGLQDYVTDQKIDLLGEPLPKEDSEQQVIDWDNQTEFEFDFDIAIAPEINAELNDKTKLPFYTIEVSDKDIDEQVKSYAYRFGHTEQVEKWEKEDMLRGKLTENKENGLVIENQVLNVDIQKDEEQKKLFLDAKKGDTIVFNPAKAYQSDVELASLLRLKKEEVAEHDGDFSFEITDITRFVSAEVNQELFDKAFGEGKVKDEAEFRAMIKADIEKNHLLDSEYRFSIDAKEAIMKQIGEVEYPDEFLKRWLKETNKEMTDERIEKEYADMLKDLTWQLAKNKLVEKYEVKIEDEDMKNYAKEVTRQQFAQYGLMHADDSLINDYAERLLKDEKQMRGIFDRVLENKMFEAVKANVKIENKTISFDDFRKLFE